MKRIDLFFEVMLAVIFWVLTIVCLALGIVHLAWWQFVIAGASCALAWMMVREIHREIYGTKPGEEKKEV